MLNKCPPSESCKLSSYCSYRTPVQQQKRFLQASFLCDVIELTKKAIQSRLHVAKDQLCLTGGQNSIRAALVEVDPAASRVLSVEALVDVFRLATGPSGGLTKHQIISIHRHLSKESGNAAGVTAALLELFEL